MGFFIYVLRPMNGQYHIPARLQPNRIIYGRLAQARKIGKQCVNHHVAHEVNLLLADAHIPQILISHFTCSKKPVGQRIGNHSIDLLGHGEVPTADAGFYVRHLRTLFLGYDSASHRGSHIAYYHHQVCRMRHQFFFKRYHDMCRQLCLRTPTAT